MIPVKIFSVRSATGCRPGSFSYSPDDAEMRPMDAGQFEASESGGKCRDTFPFVRATAETDSSAPCAA